MASQDQTCVVVYTIYEGQLVVRKFLWIGRIPQTSRRVSLPRGRL